MDTEVGLVDAVGESRENVDSVSVLERVPPDVGGDSPEMARIAARIIMTVID
jgi:hypothetical protein